MNARWDLFIPVVWVCAYSAFWWGWGYWQGKKTAEDRQLIVADYYRVKQAQAKQLYDWETHGL
jgi:hypothetical protein